MPHDSNRVLRVGVVYRGQILAERVLDKRIDVSVGQRSDCTVQVSANDHPDFPAHAQLAILHKGLYHLVLPTDSTSQINLRGGPQGSQGVQKKDVIKVKGVRVVPVEAFTGGSVAIGDCVMMFQFVRGDAVPTVTHEETVLRIGLVHEHRLLQDKIFHLGERVSVGVDKSDTLILDSLDYKGPSAEFRLESEGNVHVKLPPKCGLRFAADGAPLDEEQAVKKGVAKRTANGVELTIGMKSRGRASLGPYTLLFQVVRRTVTVPVMPRQTVLGQLLSPLVADPVWSISFLVSLLLIGSVVAQAVIFQQTTGRYLKHQRLAEFESHDTYEVIIEEKEEEEPEKPVVEIKSKEAIEEEKKEIKKEKKEKPQSTAEKTVDPEERKRNNRKVLQKRTIAGALMDNKGAMTKLFATGEGDGSVIAQTFGSASGGDDGDGPTGGLKLEGGGGGGGTIEQIKTGKKGFKREDGATKVKQKKQEKRVKISLTGNLGGSGEGKSGVQRVIARKNSAIRRCYENALRSNPNLTGKVKVAFTVGTAGTITRVSVLGAAGEFSSCIQKKFMRIRGLPLLKAPQSFTQSYVFTKG